MKSQRERIAFVTGRLAERSLRRVVDRLQAEFAIEAQVVVVEVSVAALLTGKLLERKLRIEAPVDRVVLPGYCRGDLQSVAERVGARVELGPKDLRDLPRWFRGDGRLVGEEPPEDYGDFRLEIIAEINHAPDLSLEEIVERAERYRRDGADIVDLGCNPGSHWRGLAEAVRELKDRGHRVAIDTFAPREITAAADAGVDLVLSIHSENIDAARDLSCEVVALPDDARTLAGLDRTVERLASWNVRCRLDPVLEPLGFGFAASLGRYLEVRRRYPHHAMLMGTGNLTELTDVDSAGVNALLVGFCEELGIGSVLTTEVIPWARTSVREIDIARRLMHYAVQHETLPKHVDERLVCLRDPRVEEHGRDTLQNLARRLRDPNYRIFAEDGEIHVMNRDGYWRGADAFALFDRLGMDDASHAFYLGWEMAKASLALQLGKTYRQDQALRFGFLTREEDSHQERKRRRREEEP